LEYLNTVSY